MFERRHAYHFLPHQDETCDWDIVGRERYRNNAGHKRRGRLNAGANQSGIIQKQRSRSFLSAPVTQTKCDPALLGSSGCRAVDTECLTAAGQCEVPVSLAQDRPVFVKETKRDMQFHRARRRSLRLYACRGLLIFNDRHIRIPIVVPRTPRSTDCFRAAPGTTTAYFISMSFCTFMLSSCVRRQKYTPDDI